MQPRWFALVALAALTWLAADEAKRVAPNGPLSLAVSGLCQDYIEPCGCGGRTAGGLARRGNLVKTWRGTAAGAKVLVELGDLGVHEDHRALIGRSLVSFGVDVVALSSQDLETWAVTQPFLARHALDSTSLAPPLDAGGRPLPAPYRVLEPSNGWKVGLVSAASAALAAPDLQDAIAATIGKLRTELGCQMVALASHLGDQVTLPLLAKLNGPQRPDVVLMATDTDIPPDPLEQQGCLVVYTARRGRSFSVVTVAGPGQRPTATTGLVEAGPLDGTVQAWVDEYDRKVRASEVQTTPTAATVTFPRAASCVPCHGRAVTAWRKHPHSQAVATLEKLGRDVAGCLRCHDETVRRAAVRPPDSGDRGVECATCHSGLEAHLKAPRQAKAASLNQAGCQSCHTTENSPRWDWTRYVANVHGACRGEPQSRLAPPTP